MQPPIDLTAALAQAKGVRQRAWLEALTSEIGLHPTDGRRAYGSVTAERIESFLGCLYGAGYSIEQYVTPPQRTARWHLSAWDGAAAADTRGASRALCIALGRQATLSGIEHFASELAAAGMPGADDLVSIEGLLPLLRVLTRETPCTHWVELLHGALLALRDGR